MHPESLTQSHIVHSQMRYLIPDYRDFKFGKLHFDVRDIDKLNKHLTDRREQHMGKDEKTVTATDIPLNVPVNREADIRNHATDIGICCAFLQAHLDGESKQICFWSEYSLPVEEKYSVP